MKLLAMLFFFIVLSEYSREILIRLYSDGLAKQMTLLRHCLKPLALVTLLFGLWRVVLFPYDCGPLCMGFYFYRLSRSMYCN